MFVFRVDSVASPSYMIFLFAIFALLGPIRLPRYEDIDLLPGTSWKRNIIHTRPRIQSSRQLLLLLIEGCIQLLLYRAIVLL